MSPWLKPRLIALFCGAVFVSGATYLHAQNDQAPPAKTPEEAATNFFRLLAIFRQPPNSTRLPDEATIKRLAESISRAQYQALKSTVPGNAGHEAMQLLAEQAAAEPFEAQVQSSQADQTIVSVSPNTIPNPREAVLIQEDGGYRVDIVATYARWNKLSGLAADKELYRTTRWISPTLAKQPPFVGTATFSLCQSNLKELGIAIAQYTQDYDEVMPPSRQWSYRVQPYVKSERMFSCPALQVSGKSNGYAYNSKVSQISLARINSSAQTIQLYETSNPNKNVFAPFTGRAYRHNLADIGEGMNICFTDGHVKWYARGRRPELTVEPTITTSRFLTISAPTTP